MYRDGMGMWLETCEKVTKLVCEENISNPNPRGQGYIHGNDIFLTYSVLDPLV